MRYALRPGALLIGALSGGDTVPELRKAMRAADAVAGVAAPHVHPRIEASALAALLADAGFSNPVIDVDRVPVSSPPWTDWLRIYVQWARPTSLPSALASWEGERVQRRPQPLRTPGRISGRSKPSKSCISSAWAANKG